MRKITVILLTLILASLASGCLLQKKENVQDEEITKLMETLVDEPAIKMNKEKEKPKMIDIVTLLPSERSYYDESIIDVLNNKVGEINNDRQDKKKINLVFYEMVCSDIGLHDFEKYLIVNEPIVVLALPCQNMIKQTLDTLQNQRSLNFILSNNYLKNWGDNEYTFFLNSGLDDYKTAILNELRNKSEKSLVLSTIPLNDELKFMLLRDFEALSTEEKSAYDSYILIGMSDQDINIALEMINPTKDIYIDHNPKHIKSDRKVYYLQNNQQNNKEIIASLMDDVVSGINRVGENSDALRGYLLGTNDLRQVKENNFKLYQKNGEEAASVSLDNFIEANGVIVDSSLSGSNPTTATSNISNESGVEGLSVNP